MATIFSHPAISIGLFPWFRDVRKSKAILVTGLLLTAAPDLDVVGLRMGIPYEHMLGHRGLTHSLFFAAVLAALLTTLFALGKSLRIWSIWLYLFLSMASHGAIDALTNGGLGVAFFAPFDNQRYFFPYRPIEVSTLNIRHFFEGQGVDVLLSEITFLWPPCLFALLLGYLWKKPLK